jgi:hypothetical protein
MGKYHLTFEELQKAVEYFIYVKYHNEYSKSDLNYNFIFSFTGQQIENSTDIECWEVFCDVEVEELKK